MALETLKDVKEIGGFKVTRGKPENISWDDYDKTRSEYPIHISDKINSISFRIQDGPIKENGVNGCQVDTLIETALHIISAFNKKFPCRENDMTLISLDQALMYLNERKSKREARGVEGTSKA